MNKNIFVTINQGLRVEHVGDEIVVLDSVGLVVHTLTGDVARCFNLVANGQTEPEVSPALETLAAAGLVTISNGTDETAVSRRKALSYAGAGVVVVGLSSMALPTAANAVSAPPPPPPPTTIPSGQPTNDGIIGTAKSGLTPVRYFVTANWEDDNPPNTDWSYTYEVSVGSASPVLIPGTLLYSGSGTGFVSQRIFEWNANATLLVTMTLTSSVGSVVYEEENLSRP